MTVALIIALVSAIIGAIIGAYLQKRWTPDYSAELAAFRQQIAGIQKQYETLEQERAEAEHLSLNMSLQNGYSRNYVIVVENDSAREITVEKIGLRRNGVWLCELCKPKAMDGGPSVASNSRKQINLELQYDPAATLRSAEPELAPGKCIGIELLMDYKVFGRPKQFSKTILVTINGYQMTQFSA